MTTADFLLIDIGNTAAKLRLAGESVCSAGPAACPRPHYSRQVERMSWRKHSTAGGMGTSIISSVVPDAARVLTGLLPGALSINARTDTGVDLRGYPGRKTLGADRLANMAGALALHGPGPLIVVDFGTAATFNALDATRALPRRGIAPGWAVCRGYLPRARRSCRRCGSRARPRRPSGVRRWRRSARGR